RRWAGEGGGEGEIRRNRWEDQRAVSESALPATPKCVRGPPGPAQLRRACPLLRERVRPSTSHRASARHTLPSVFEESPSLPGGAAGRGGSSGGVRLKPEAPAVLPYPRAGDKVPRRLVERPYLRGGGRGGRDRDA